jgi:glycyl-tRNA synthetase
VDIEYEFPFGWGELQGIANRGAYDLTQHGKHSGKDLSFFDPDSKERFVPTVIEPSFGVERTCLAILCAAYAEDEVEGETRVVMRFDPRIAPVKAGVFPLVKKDGLAEIARDLEKKLRRRYVTFYDQGGAIGRRYRRMDEIGTPLCITVDYETKENETVTIRDRDTLQQVRVKMDDVAAYIDKKCSHDRT